MRIRKRVKNPVIVSFCNAVIASATCCAWQSTLYKFKKNIFCDFDDIDCHALDFAKMQNLIARNDAKTLTTKNPKNQRTKPPQNQTPTKNLKTLIDCYAVQARLAMTKTHPP